MKSSLPALLHVCPRHSFSGLEAWVLEMARFHAERGSSCALLVLKGSPLARRAAEVSSAGSSLQIRHVDSRSASALRRAVHEATSELRPDVIHLHASQDFKVLVPWIAVQRWVRKMPALVLQSHIWISHAKRDPVNWFLHRWVDQYWCSSEPARRSIETLIPIDPARIRVLRYGRAVKAMEAEMLTRAEARRELGIPAEQVVVGTVSRIDRGKGTAELIDGCARVMEREPGLALSIVGNPTGDPLEAAFFERQKQKVAAMPENLRSRIVFHGAVAGSHRILRAFDLFALPTYRECFSLALMEAQLAGLPCIATNAGGSPELVREGSTGWLCEPQSTSAFGAALDRAIRSKDDWMRFGQTARERVMREYDLTPALAETLDRYREVLAARSVQDS